MLVLECTPDIRAFTLRLDQPVEHGFVTHSEDALNLEDADEERVPPSPVPLRRKRGFWHQEVACKGVGLVLCLHGEFCGVAPIFSGVEQQMAEFVCPQ